MGRDIDDLLAVISGQQSVKLQISLDAKSAAFLALGLFAALILAGLVYKRLL